MRLWNPRGWTARLDCFPADERSWERKVVSGALGGRGILVRAIFLGLVAATAVGAAEVYTVRGLTEPVQDVLLSVPTQGLIAALPHAEGDFIEAGAVILELSSRTEQLEKTRRELQLATLAKELERSELLFKTSSSSTLEELDRKRADVQIAEVELEQATEMLARRRVVSPIAGTITNLPVKIGEYCDIGKPVARVVDSREFFVTANVDPKRAGHLRTGDGVEIEVPGQRANVVVAGKVSYVSPVIDPASGLMRIRARFPNSNDEVRPGAAGTLRINPASTGDGN